MPTPKFPALYATPDDTMAALETLLDATRAEHRKHAIAILSAHADGMAIAAEHYSDAETDIVKLVQALVDAIPDHKWET